MLGKGLLIALALAVTGHAQAHDTWLEARGGEPGKALQLTSGMAFPALDYAIKSERVARAWGRTTAGEATLATPRRGKQALQFAVPKTPGIYAVQLAPKSLELTPDKVAEYLDEIHAAPALREHWQATPEPRRWREEYVKHSKTLAARGKDCADLFGTILGLGLEIVPDADPCQLVAGATLAMRVLQDGVPKRKLILALVAEGGQEVSAQATDAEGRASFTLPRRGRWLLRAVDLRPASREDLDWQSDFTTFTFSNR